MVLLGAELVAAEAAFWATNRAFRYGDGFFETVVWAPTTRQGPAAAQRPPGAASAPRTQVAGSALGPWHNALRCWPQHLARIRRGAAALHLVLPPDFDQNLPTLLHNLLTANHLTEQAARIRWQCWRTGGGLYTPETNLATWLATVEAMPPPPTEPGEPTPCARADFGQTVRTAPSVISFLKGPNAALYTLAALEKQARGLDELLLLSPDGHVAEATAAAVLWVKGTTLFTPDAAATGAVAGVRLATLLEKARATGWTVVSGCYTPAALLAADAVATVSVTAITWLTEVAGNRFGRPVPTLRALCASV